MTLLAVENLTRAFALARPGLFATRPVFTALDGVSFELARGEILGIVGESGSGKSTLARLVTALDRPTSGRVRFDGDDLFALDARALRQRRRGFQMVFQDPFGSLDPRMPVGRSIAEPLALLHPTPRGAARRGLIARALAEVGLERADAERLPHAFSGGQRQRIAIARALITRPALIVADEPVSALDVSIQGQILNLLLDLRDHHGIAVMLITHDLAIAEQVCDRIAVMQRGRIVEIAPAARLFEAPGHPYTKTLLEATRRLDPAMAGSRGPATSS